MPNASAAIATAGRKSRITDDRDDEEAASTLVVFRSTAEANACGLASNQRHGAPELNATPVSSLACASRSGLMPPMSTLTTRGACWLAAVIASTSAAGRPASRAAPTPIDAPRSVTTNPASSVERAHQHQPEAGARARSLSRTVRSQRMAARSDPAVKARSHDAARTAPRTVPSALCGPNAAWLSSGAPAS